MTRKGRAVILMMDSFGIGGAEDAAKFGDAGADTLGHIAAARGGLNVPNLAALGLFKAAEASTGKAPAAGAQTKRPFRSLPNTVLCAKSATAKTLLPAIGKWRALRCSLSGAILSRTIRPSRRN